MKLAQEEIKKIGIGLLGLGGVTFVYFTFLLGPLQDSQANARRQIADAQPKITLAKAQIAKKEAAEVAAPIASLTTKQITSLIQDGSPVAWYPPQVAEFFRREGIDKVATRMNSEAADKELPKYKRISWTIDLPKVEFTSFAQALADFENEQLLSEIASVQIDILRQDAESQHVSLTVNSLVNQ